MTLYDVYMCRSCDAMNGTKNRFERHFDGTWTCFNCGKRARPAENFEFIQGPSHDNPKRLDEDPEPY